MHVVLKRTARAMIARKSTKMTAIPANVNVKKTRKRVAVTSNVIVIAVMVTTKSAFVRDVV